MFCFVLVGVEQDIYTTDFQVVTSLSLSVRSTYVREVVMRNGT